MKMLLAVLPVCFLLAGCPEPMIRTVDREVKVIVKVPCKITPIEKPIMPMDTTEKTEDLLSKGKAALAELEVRKAYELKLEAGIKECE